MTKINLYNTRTRKKEPFEPIDPANVRMYVCGPTVYDRAHIGNARPVVVFDVLYRLLHHVYGEGAVTYARNFTDVDDKINDRAAATLQPGETVEAAARRITDETIGWYHEDMDALGALRPNVEPRCTDFVPQMVAMTETLIGQGHAYAAEGHVLFDVATYDGYGKLSGRPLDDMIAGSRVEVAPYKRSPMDFVIWKPSTPEQPGWDSPWGRGRPGWHIECSAMADALLWEKPFRNGQLSKEALRQPHVFDIHGGGIDLVFPHHENEVAQSCCANHTDVMANVWMHNGFLQVEGEKMAKSAGNFFTVKDLLDRGVPGEVIRFVLLRTNYRQPLDWTEKKVAEARMMLLRWHEITIELEPSPDNKNVNQNVLSALADDLNTSLAMTALNALQHNPQELLDSARLLGILNDDARADWRAQNSLEGFRLHYSGEPTEEELSILERFRDVYFSQYKVAKALKKFNAVDELRSIASSVGIGVKVTVNMIELDVSGPLNEEAQRRLLSAIEALQ